MQKKTQLIHYTYALTLLFNNIETWQFSISVESFF